MNQNSLTVFCTLYETGNMHKTAEQLFLSQQAVSKSIRTLEQELETVLFLRTSAGVMPTQAGEALYPEAVKLRRAYSELHRKVKDAQSARKSISLVCAYGTLYQVFPVIRQFETQNPDIAIHWKELPDVQVRAQLLDERADLAVNVEGRPSRYVKSLPLYEKQICLLVYEGHRLYEAEQIRFADLQGERIILEGEDFQIYALFRQFCERAGVYPQIAAQTSDIGFCQYMAQLHEGLSVTVDFVAQAHRLTGVRAIPFAEPDFAWKIVLELPVNQPDRQEIRRFAAFLQDAFHNEHV